MEKLPVTFSSMGQLFSECVADGSCQISCPVSPRAEVICPKPVRARAPYQMDNISKLNPQSKSILPEQKGNRALDFFDIILGMDDSENDPKGFLWGSPPVRSNNPMVNDAQFTKQNISSASPLGTSLRGSPSCGSPLKANPKVRIEGFACGSSDSGRIVHIFG